jgi:nitroreductase
METLVAIHSRHSQEVKSDPLPRELVEKLLSAAVQAPNHYKVLPWRFVVLSGRGLDALGEQMVLSFKRKFPDAPAIAFEKERQKPLRAPLIIAVAVDLPVEPKVKEIENICAAAAACQNILLAATDLGLGAKWRTGDAARDPEIKKFLGLDPQQNLIAFLYIGYPEFIQENLPERPSFEDRTFWME